MPCHQTNGCKNNNDEKPNNKSLHKININLMPTLGVVQGKNIFVQTKEVNAIL